MMAARKTRSGSKVKGQKTSNDTASAPIKTQESKPGHIAVGTHGIDIDGSKRVLRNDMKNHTTKSEPGGDMESSALSRSPPTIPFVTRPRMISRLSATKKMVGIPSAGKPTTFESFGKLPPELRTKIWNYAIPGPRVIQVKVKVILSKYSSHVRGMHFDSSTPVPAMLHACHESRVVALLHYELGMSSHLSGPRIYIDFKKDTIYLGERNMNGHFTLSAMIRDMSERELSKIRFLAMSQLLWNHKPFCNGHVLMDFRSLKSITLVMERENSSSHKNVAFAKPKEEDHTIVELYDPDLTNDDDDEGYFWPCEMEDLIVDQLLDCFDDKGRDIPDVKFRMLVGNDKRKGKGKGKVAAK